jgi:hypothetical protein
MTDDDPNEAYEVVPIEPGPHGPPKGWWTVKRNGLPVRHFPGKENAQRYATDPEYRASLITGRREGNERQLTFMTFGTLPDLSTIIPGHR